MFGRRKRERSASGAPILRHATVERRFEDAVAGESALHAAVEAHLETHLGPATAVWHELLSDLVPIDVCMWEPTAERNMYVFATVGMSDLAMTLDKGAKRCGATSRAELVLCLPPDWPVPPDATAAPWLHEDAYFPIRWLKRLARFPHEHRTWIGVGHTVPHGDPPDPLAPMTELCGWVFLPPIALPAAIGHLKVPGHDRVDILGIVALLPDEMEQKLRSGLRSLAEGFERDGVSELLAVSRPSSVRA